MSSAHQREALERWCTALAARGGVARYELREGNSTVVDVLATEGPARVAELLTSTAGDFVSSWGKAVIFRATAVDSEARIVAYMPLRLAPPAADVAPPDRGDLAEALKLELAHNQKLVAALVESMRSITDAHTRLSSVALERAADEAKRANAAEDLARDAADFADKALTKAEKAEAQAKGAKDPTEQMAESLALAAGMRALGMPSEAISQLLVAQGVPQGVAASVAKDANKQLATPAPAPASNGSAS